MLRVKDLTWRCSCLVQQSPYVGYMYVQARSTWFPRGGKRAIILSEAGPAANTLFIDLLRAGFWWAAVLNSDLLPAIRMIIAFIHQLLLCTNSWCWCTRGHDLKSIVNWDFWHFYSVVSHPLFGSLQIANLQTDQTCQIAIRAWQARRASSSHPTVSEMTFPSIKITSISGSFVGDSISVRRNLFNYRSDRYI